MWADFPVPPDLSHFVGMSTGESKRIRVGQPIFSMTQNEVFRADEVVIEGPIYTNGHQLTIDTRNLIFRDSGEIRGFQAPAAGFATAAPSGMAGQMGADASERGFPGGDGGRGGDGSAGLNGTAGQDDPKPVLIFAAHYEGTVQVNLNGQDGAAGQDGGTGGRGGDGGKGGQGEVNYIGRTCSGGTGGAPGVGGNGGPAGSAGIGGRAIPFVFLTAKKGGVLHLASLPGKGGAGGKGGREGSYGTPGAGGEGAHIFLKSASPGRTGDPYPWYSVSFYSGRDGQCGFDGLDCHLNEPVFERFRKDPRLAEPRSSGTILFHFRNLLVKEFSHLEWVRSEVLQAWYTHHWYRILKLLLEDTITEIRELSPQVGSSSRALQRQRQNVDRRLFRDLMGQWQNHFLDLIREMDVGQSVVIGRDELIPLVEPLVNGMDQIWTGRPIHEVNSMLSETLQIMDGAYQSTLDQAVDACQHYIQDLEASSRQWLGLTQHFSVPVCDGVQLDMSEHQNIRANYVLAEKYALSAPLGVVVETMEPLAPLGQEVATLRSWFSPVFFRLSDAWTQWTRFVFSPFSIQSAFAGQSDPELLKQDHYVQALRQILPSNPRRFLRSMEAKVPLARDLRKYRAFYLHSLALLNGSALEAKHPTSLPGIPIEAHGEAGPSSPVRPTLASHAQHGRATQSAARTQETQRLRIELASLDAAYELAVQERDEHLTHALSLSDLSHFSERMVFELQEAERVETLMSDLKRSKDELEKKIEALCKR
ncbi:MAG: hypothetical protein ACO3A2_09620 [Bdellovibrionia bacterium]